MELKQGSSLYKFSTGNFDAENVVFEEQNLSVQQPLNTSSNILTLKFL